VGPSGIARNLGELLDIRGGGSAQNREEGAQHFVGKDGRGVVLRFGAAEAAGEEHTVGGTVLEDV